MIVVIEGALHSLGPIFTLPGSERICRKAIIEKKHNDARMRNDYFPVIIYGKDDIWKFLENHNDKIKNQECRVTVKLTGRIKNGRDSLTLTFKSVHWII